MVWGHLPEHHRRKETSSALTSAVITSMGMGSRSDSCLLCDPQQIT